MQPGWSLRFATLLTHASGVASTTREKGWRESQLVGVATAETLLRQAKLGAFDRMKVSIGQGLTSLPYRVLRQSWQQ